MKFTVAVVATIMAQLGATKPVAEVALESYQFFADADCAGTAAGSGSFDELVVCETAGEAIRSVQFSSDECYWLMWSSEEACNANPLFQPWFSQVNADACTTLPDGSSEAFSVVFEPCNFN